MSGYCAVKLGKHLISYICKIVVASVKIKVSILSDDEPMYRKASINIRSSLSVE